MRPLTALLISDGRPGHYHLSEGVIAAAQRIVPLDVQRVDVKRPRFMPGPLLAALVNSGVAPLHIWRTIHGLDPDALGPADLIVSAGAETLAVNAAAARLLRVPNIFYGSLRYFRPADFALVLTSFPKRAVLPRHAMAIKPSPLDPDALPLPRPGAKRIGALLGGPTREVRYTADDWSRLFSFLSAYSGQTGARWIVSNSRRTPHAVSEELLRLAGESDSGIARVIDVRTAGPGTLKQLFAETGTVLCTVDSSSMVSEAVWLRRRVIAVAPAYARAIPNEQTYRHFLEEQGWTRTLGIANLTPAAFDEAAVEIVPIDSNPLDVLAGLLRERLPGVFGG